MDILCQAKSGMGKTAVFVLATLQQIEPVDGQVWSGVRYFTCQDKTSNQTVIEGFCVGDVSHQRAGLPDQ